MAEAPILVTGGAGYVGSHLTRFLLEQGYPVHVLDNLTYGSQGIDDIKDHPGLVVFEGDICNIKDVVRAVKGTRVVIALAAIVGDPAAALDEDETNSTNYESTKVMVEACEHYGVERLVFASSCSVYGANSDIMLNEGSWLNPVSLYAKTRILSEQVLLGNCRAVVPVILRLSTVFGLSWRMRFDLVVNILTAKACREGKIQIFGGSQWRPLIHVQDVARAFIVAALAPLDVVRGEIFNVGGNDLNYQIKDVGEIVKSVLPDTEVDMKPEDPDRRDYRVSFDKIRSLLDFVPEKDIEFGVCEIRDFLDTNPIDLTDDIYYNVKYLFKFNK
jgi:nucleoside-diphosphate-sugar epimerase